MNPMNRMAPRAIRLQLRQLLLAHAKAADPETTFCPSVVAQQVGAARWHTLMPAVHAAARELIEEGVLEAWHVGRPVYHGESLQGPLRLRLRSNGLAARWNEDWK